MYAAFLGIYLFLGFILSGGIATLIGFQTFEDFSYVFTSLMLVWLVAVDLSEELEKKVGDGS